LFPKIAGPFIRKCIPPFSQFFIPAQFGGINAGNFKFVGFFIQIYFHKSGLGIFNFLIIKPNGRKCPIQRNYKKQFIIVLYGWFYFPDLELKLSILKEKLNVLQVSCYIFIGNYLSIQKQIVLYLNIFIPKNLLITVPDDDIFIPCGSRLVS